MPVKGLIFDFDGLLVDTETLHHRVWTNIYQRHGVELRLDRWLLDLGTHGMFDPCADIEELTGQAVDHQALRDEQRAEHHRLCEQEPLRPGVQTLLAAGREAGLPMAVASSSTRDWVERWLEHHGVRHYFNCVRTRDDVERVKPAPDLFLAAAACLDVAPAECVVFEDSPNGMRAARAAGIRCVAVPTNLLEEVELPEVALRLRSLDEMTLADLIERLDEEIAQTHGAQSLSNVGD
jgi:HAD superfamily hydrolase (TIGR01509 family)